MNITEVKRFLSKFGKNLDHSIIITDEKGVIVAGTIAAMEGGVHPLACTMIKNGTDFAKVEPQDLELDVPSGIYFLIKRNGQRIGVGGLLGEPDMIQDSAQILKAAIETMLENENSQELAYSIRYNDSFERLKYCLLYAKDASIFELRSLLGRYGYEENALRAAILVSVNDIVLAQNIYREMGVKKLYNKNDIVFISREGCVVLFKTFMLPNSNGICVFHHELEAYSKQLYDFIKNFTSSFGEYVGSVQSNPLYLHTSYSHCLWLRETQQNVSYPLFFHRLIQDYFNDLVPMLEMHKIFSVFDDCMDEEFCDMFIKTIGALENNCYNLQASSQSLFIHKNTLALWIKHINARFNTDFMHNYGERDFMRYLRYYLGRRRINKN